jgi:phospholipid/cholesterol/gamma-HCH transport system permease protein
MESATIPPAGTPVPLPAARKPPARRTGFIPEMGELAVFSFQALRAIPGSLRYFSEALRINASITRRTSLLLFVMCMFLGFSIANFSFFFLRSIGASDLVGIVPGLVDGRQLAPQMFAYVFSGSVCCAMAAEIGAAKIQEEIDAYEAVGVDPMELLVGTRLVAVLLFVPLASVLSMAGILAGSYVTIVPILKGNTSHQYLDTFFSIFPIGTLLKCSVMIACLTLQCALVACFYGMRSAAGGPAAVGAAVARSLGVNLLLLHFNFAITALLFFGGSLGVPIGD